MLQRTRADQVAATYPIFVERYPEARYLARETPSGLLHTIGRLGLRWRAPLMIRMAAAVESLGGEPPEEHNALVSLPGVGPYAAGAFLSLHRDRRAVLLDSNIVRCLGRVFGFWTGPETRRRRVVRELCDQLTPRRRHREFNYALLDLSMQVCRPKPRCLECPLASGVCEHYASTADVRVSVPRLAARRRGRGTRTRS